MKSCSKQEINTELKNLHMWCCANILTINPSKSNALIISPKLLQTSPLHLSINCNNNPVNVVESTKHLGVILDDNLNFKQHIKVLESKVTRSVGILCKLKNVFPQTILLQLYYALVHSLLIYGNIIWASTYPSYLQKLKVLQNRAVRAVSGSHYRDSISPIYAKLKILKIEDLHYYEIAKFMYKFNRLETPSAFKNYFTKTSNISNKSTRQTSTNNLYIPRYRTNKLQRCIKYQGVKVWNSVPTELKNLALNYSFNRQLKEFLISSY
jgi:hypothetical protein